MSDIFTKEKRSEIMAHIRSQENKDTELALVKLLREYGLKGWRRQQRIFGKPDFVFPKFRVAVFVDGCFWHGCPKHTTQPKSNRAFWQRKLDSNKRRDRLVTRTLRKDGWYVIRIWECTLKQNPQRCLRRIAKQLGIFVLIDCIRTT